MPGTPPPPGFQDTAGVTVPGPAFIGGPARGRHANGEKAGFATISFEWHKDCFSVLASFRKKEYGMKILLISPRATNFTYAFPGWLQIPQLALSILASLTPPEHEVVMCEDEYEPLPADGNWDVVGITTMTATAQRAYELAGRYRREGARVVLGGIHASVLPEEAARHADAVVVGEAEGTWRQVLLDAGRDRLRRIYAAGRPDLSGLPLPLRRPKRSWFGLPPVITPVMASRGCPNRCDFCCVHAVYGNRQRHVPVSDILEDIRESGGRTIIFLDDNIWGSRAYALELFKGLAPLKVRWVGQASARSILDDELFDLALRSGLMGLFVGVECIEPDVLRKLRKSFDSVAQYEEAIARCRKAGVFFLASLIFGMDEQSPRVFERTLDFLLRNSVPAIAPNMLTPYPGTRLYARLKREGRILHENWAYYDHLQVDFRPRAMEPEELTEKYLDFRERFYSFSSIFRRAPAQLRVAPLIYLGTNMAYRLTTREHRKRARDYFKWLRGEAPGASLGSVRPASPPVASSLRSVPPAVLASEGRVARRRS